MWLKTRAGIRNRRPVAETQSIDRLGFGDGDGRWGKKKPFTLVSFYITSTSNHIPVTLLFTNPMPTIPFSCHGEIAAGKKVVCKI
jgi:hypothetical protein